MIVVDCERVLSPEEGLRLWKDTEVPAMEPTVRLGSDSILCRVDGEDAILLSRLGQQDAALLRQALLRYPMDTVVRGKGLRSASRVFGFVASSPVLQRTSCRSANGADVAPAQHRIICGTAGRLAETLLEMLPNQHALNLEAAQQVRDEWKLPGGLWTSGVVNRSAALPYHRDRNNLDAWSAMPVIRRAVRGGHLHFPELALPDGSPVVAACDDGDVLFFNGQKYMHGVTPLKRVMQDGYRYSCVYYPVKKMCNCLSPAEELERGRQRRSETETGMIERHRAQGYINESLEVHDE